MQGKTLPNLLVSKEEASRKIQAKIEEGQQLHDRRINLEDELDKAIMDADNWSDYSTDLLASLFDRSAAGDRYISFDYCRLSEHEIDDYQLLGYSIPDLQYEVHAYQKSMATSINSLKGICNRLEIYEEPSDTHQPTSTPQRTFGDKVFIVHGHDEAAKLAIADFVKTYDLNPIILDEKANEGQTIIEKFEAHAGEAGYAIILLTPDDVGAAKDQANDLKPRTRQNVILELGYFLGALGRERVCVLHKEKVELPSDIHGVLYIPMDSSDGWQLKLAKEVKQAGLPIDLNKLV